MRYVRRHWNHLLKKWVKWPKVEAEWPSVRRSEPVGFTGAGYHNIWVLPREGSTSVEFRGYDTPLEWGVVPGFYMMPAGTETKDVRYYTEYERTGG